MRKIRVIKLIVLTAFVLIAGRIFCGWMCSFGAVSDWIWEISEALRKKAKKRIPGIPVKVQRRMQQIKYVLLAGILASCFFGHSEAVTSYSPWTAFSFLRVLRYDPKQYAAAGILLLLSMAGAVFCERFFCQFFCPMGAFFSLLPDLKALSLKRNAKNCPGKCDLCRKACPVSIRFAENEFIEGECFRCWKCAAGCPKNNISLKRPSA